jgi:L-lactate dehydrogenase complex protein LldG
VDRQDFFARLAQAGARLPREQRPEPLALEVPADLAGHFLAQAQAVGCGVQRAQGPDEALAMALELAASSGAVSLGLADLGPEFAPHLAPAAARAGINLVQAGDDVPGAARLIEPLAVGLTRPELALAREGALVQASRPGGGYLLSLLPPLHIALVKVCDLLPGLADLPAALADPQRFPAGRPAALCLIAGPSKTGDIEAIMIRGVHGPGRVEVVLWG